MGEVIEFPQPEVQQRPPEVEEDARPETQEGRRLSEVEEGRRAARRETGATDAPTQPDPLWRDLAGDVLRAERHAAGRTLADVAEEAGISTQYLSEVERGRKEPSSEVLSAVAGALGLRLGDVTSRVTRRLATYSGPDCLAA